MTRFKKILVANRGEIAVRIIRALRDMHIPSLAVYSEADRTSLHVRLADEAVCIGPAAAQQSYLHAEAILAAAKTFEAEAIHPGYGFLAENAAFAKACQEWGFVFIGPSPQAIQTLGHKAQAKELARKCAVPLVPGTAGCLNIDFKKEEERHRLHQQAKQIGYPLMIKAAAGGGGKGLRTVSSSEFLEKEILAAQQEAQSVFKDGAVFIEKLIESPRHVEIQMAADSHGNVVAFPERDCSIQRRHQKLIEESPSPAVSSKLREELAHSAIRLAKAANYTNLGTVEFLLDSQGKFYFIEVNTRLQVEHPVTEAVTGMDLVREQILLAAGEKLSVSQEQALSIRGHAIEHRINAEDSARQFAPSPGEVSSFLPPGGPGIRLDTFLYPGYAVPSHYDSLVAKLIAHGSDRAQALSRARRALNEFMISGIVTTIPFHLRVLENENFLKGIFDTHFIESMNGGPKP
ncbi:MAG: acetyl-CoA carboxylase biotin carboxylase subunit [Elusimicrobia bacterium]|nr:acetyl-CoA carboxylase biotin carboxylase subunit [Elusimicrobiota bacterium]